MLEAEQDSINKRTCIVHHIALIQNSATYNTEAIIIEKTPRVTSNVDTLQTYGIVHGTHLCLFYLILYILQLHRLQSTDLSSVLVNKWYGLMFLVGVWYV